MPISLTLSSCGEMPIEVTTTPEPAGADGTSGPWLTNVIVFALWYWRIDGGGPTRRQERDDFGSESFLFPQMQIPSGERRQFACTGWRPHFVDYLFIAFTQSSTFGPTDAPLLARWAKILAMIQVFISLSIVVLLISRAVGAL